MPHLSSIPGQVALSLALLGALAPAAAADFQFAIIGDRTGSHQAGVYERTLAEVRAFAPDFAVTVGDQIEGYTDDRAVLDGEWDEYLTLVADLGCPLYLCPGNHDILSDAMEEVWRERTSRTPAYSFDVEGVHFVILDTGRWESSAEWLDAGDHRAWLDADLGAHSGARLTIVVYHKPFWYDTLAEGLPDPMHEIFRAHGVDAVFNGHFHQYGAARYDGIDYTIVGSSGGAIEGVPEQGSFYHWAWATVRGDRLSWAVIAEEGVRPMDVVEIVDQKFYQRAYSDYARLESFAIEEADAPTGARCRLALRNANAEAPLSTTLTWEVPANWLIEPETRAVEIAAGATLETVFAVTRSGPFYPLPHLAFEYPYREGRVFRYQNPLPALRTQAARRLAATPSIDGDPGESVWTATARAEALGTPQGDALAVIEPAVFYFGYDDEALYLAARCAQADPAMLLTNATERDGAVHLDDCVGYFLCADPEEKQLFQIYVSAAGVVMDREIVWATPERYEGRGPDWNGEMTVAAARAEGRWAVEARIPFTTLEAERPGPGDRWRINFRRKEPSRGSSADWQVPVDFRPATFGYLAFE